MDVDRCPACEIMACEHFRITDNDASLTLLHLSNADSEITGAIHDPQPEPVDILPPRVCWKHRNVDISGEESAIPPIDVAGPCCPICEASCPEHIKNHQHRYRMPHAVS